MKERRSPMCRTEKDHESMNDSCLCYPRDQGDRIARLKRYQGELEEEIATVEERLHQMRKEEGEEDA
jgi:hypothetical protein